MSTKSYVTFLVTTLLTWIATPPLLADNVTAVAYQPRLIIAQSRDQLAVSASTRQVRSQPDARGNSCDHNGKGDPTHCQPVSVTTPTPDTTPETPTTPTPVTTPTTPATPATSTAPVSATPATPATPTAPVSETPATPTAPVLEKPATPATPATPPAPVSEKPATPAIPATPTTPTAPVSETPAISTVPVSEKPATPTTPAIPTAPAVIPATTSPTTEVVPAATTPVTSPTTPTAPVVTPAVTTPVAPIVTPVTPATPVVSTPVTPEVPTTPSTTIVVTPPPVTNPQPTPVTNPSPPVTTPLPVVEPLIPLTAPVCPKTDLLTETCLGQHQTLTDVTINPGVSISQVTLAGTITNQGWVSNATILPNATVTGGTLTGFVTNQGTLSNIQFVGDTLTGGQLTGQIAVNPTSKLEGVTISPNTHLDGGTLSNAQVMDGATLTNVTLGDHTQWGSGVIIGQGVRFENNNQIPVGTNLTAAFVSGNTLNLQTEVVSGPVLTLLQQLNQIPDLQKNQWQFEQNNGQLQLTMAGIRFALLPVSVTQVGTDQPVGMTKNPDDSIRFVTSSGREIVAQPMIQDMDAFQQALGLAPQDVRVTTEGVVQVNTGEDSWNAFRPSVESNPVGSEQPPGLFDAPDQLNAKKLVFLDETGQTREQVIYSACAYPEQWQAYQASLPAGTNSLVLGQDGTVSVTIDGQRYHGVCDATVTVAQTNSQAASAKKETNNNLLSFVKAKDGKGLVVVYPNGAQQTFYAVTDGAATSEEVTPYGSCQTRRLVAEEGTTTATTAAEVFSSTVKLEKVVPGQAKTLVHDEATLAINELAVIGEQTLAIKSLRARDLPPLDVGMTNVTKGPRKGYRFLPHHTRFQSKQQVKVPYDKKLLPEGTNEADITTFYFDDEVCKWVALEKTTVDTKTQEVVSNTDHFTDMINSVVTVPEAPETVAYNPNQLKDIKAADPGTGVTLIEPPQANNMGGAGVSYPLEVPPGRAGLQPQLAVQYNSSGGNGWLGLGWDVAMQTVTIDTRWGVPRYDASLETETYTLSGQQLTPLAHRGVLQSRTAEKVFQPRVEGSFARIIRHGDSPKNYWWEVTDKNGTVSSYGGEGATLSDDNGNVFVWALREVRDTHGNMMQYRYDMVTDTGLPDGTVPGRELYLKTIHYTGYQGETGPYQVKLIRDRELGEARRPDVNIDARGGFKRVSADLLRKVEVSFNGQMIRSYELNYKEGAFKKTLLSSVTHYGEDGSVFYAHSFEYYDESRDTQGGYKGFATPDDWNTGNDKISGGAVFLGQGDASALGGSLTNGIGAHLYVGVGSLGTSKKNSAGAKIGFNHSKSKGLVAMIDINGDGLEDKVYKDGDSIYYRANQSGTTSNTQFGEPRLIANLPAISEDSSNMLSVGVEAYFGITAGYNHSHTFNKSLIYFSDVNSDGLPDLVNKGKVLFNHCNDQGECFFSPNSADTTCPVGAGAVDTAGLVEDFEALYQEQLDKFPLLDTLRRWTAPYDGFVRISGEVALLEDTSTDRQEYTTADGVRVAVQQNDSELWATEIKADDYTPKSPLGLESIQVQKGDVIYFRVQSILDGAYDQVSWTPEIQYLNVPTTPPVLDANGLEVFHYHAAKDFALGGASGMDVTMPLDGKIRVTGELEKLKATSDDVTLILSKNDQPIYTQEISGQQLGSVVLDQEIDVVKNDRLALRVKIDSPVDLTQLQWQTSNPLKLFYTASSEVPQLTNDQGEPLIKMDFFSSYDLYPESDLTSPLLPWVAPKTDTYTVSSLLAVMPPDFLDLAKPLPQGTVVMTVKRQGELLAKYPVEVVAGQVLNGSVSFQANAGDLLFIELSTLNHELATQLSQVAVGVTDSGGTTYSVATELHSAGASQLIAQAYRGWTAFGYDGNRDRATRPVLITEEDLNGKALQDAADQMKADAEAGKIDENYQSPVQLKVMPFYPDMVLQQWKGTKDNIWIRADKMSSSRNGTNTIEVPRASQFAGAQAVTKMGISKGDSLSLGFSVLSGAVTKGKSFSLIDYLDLNGDRYPDILSKGGVQFTLMTGELEAQKRSGIVDERIRESKNLSANLGVGGNYPIMKGKKAVNQMVSIGLNGGLTTGQSDSQYDLMDVNGDGLPDKVSWEDGNLQVALNIGYGFLPAETWGNAAINHTISNDVSLGGSAGYNLGNDYSFAAGISLTRSGSDPSQSKMLLDVNGDGLIDKVSIGGDTLFDGDELLEKLSGGLIKNTEERITVSVSLNTGNGFAAPINWPVTSNKGMGASSSINFGGGVYFTISIPILAVRLVINPGADYSRNMNRQEVSVADINGDGYPDYLYSEKDNQIQVGLSQIGRTNMLKRVNRPLGASFTIDYQRQGNTFNQPSSSWVMSKVEVDDGHPGDGVDKLVTTYRYENGFYHRQERDFYGYQTVVTETRDTANQVYRAVMQTFYNDSYYNKGLLHKEVMTDAAGKRYSETENTYELRDVSTGQPLVNPNDLTATVFPASVRVDKRFYEGQEVPGKTTYETNEYDALGNVIHFFDAGDVGAADDVNAEIGYFFDATRYLNKPNRIVVTNNGVVMRKREADFAPGTGELIQVRQYLADGQAAIADISYDQYGNLQQLMGPANYKGQRYGLSYRYDDQVHTYNVSARDSFGYESTARYHLKYGQIEQTLDTNQQPMVYTYDNFGRVKTVTGPYEVGKQAYTIRFEYHPEATVPWALTQHIDTYRNLSDPLETVLFVDGLKRVLQTKKDGTVHQGGSGQSHDVLVVSGLVEYDFVGRSVKQYYPVTEPLGKPGVFNPQVDTVSPTMMVYDVLDRQLRTTLPDNTVTTTSYGFGADRNGQVQFLTRATDANGKTKESYTDVNESVVAVKEFNNGGQQVIWTSYEYDALNQIVKVLDDHQNLTEVRYDNLGRRTHLNNPDTGLTETVYDLASNVVKKITANLREKGQAIVYEYDYKHLLKVTYPQFTGNNVTYTYGAPGATFNRAGRVVTVSDESGTEESFYGPLGEVVKTIKTIASDTGSQPEVYTTTYEYDTWNRLQTLVYPDGEVLTNRYDSGGLLAAVRGDKAGNGYEYVNRLEYDKFEQRVFLELGNKVRTTYSYTASNRRLESLQTGKASGRTFQNLTYQYDKVGNILGQANLATVTSPNQMGGATQFSYQYDDLYRLVGAHGAFQEARQQHRYQLEMAYDSVHNIVSKSQLAEWSPPSGNWLPQKKVSYDFQYAYTGRQPHAPSHIGEQTFSYDANGNQTGWTHDQNGTRRQIVWDEENRIQAVIDNGHEMTYKYNAAGERVIKRGPQGETAYVNQFFVIRNGAVATKQVYAASSRVVSKVVKQEKAGIDGQNGVGKPKGSAKGVLEKQVYFYHPDHLGSTSYVTDAKGEVYQHIEYFPFGESWVEQVKNPQTVAFGFTGKELDAETGLYYFGARYYDARTSVWVSPDPILDKYLPTGKKDEQLPGMGGVFNSFNLGLYSYGHLNPVKFVDPDGNQSQTPGNISDPQKYYKQKGIASTTNPNYGKFGLVRDNGKKAHNGIDISGNIGDKIPALAGGKVRVNYYPNRKTKGYGMNVAIIHDNGDVSLYAHLDSVSVKNGQRVEFGDVIGTMGRTGDPLLVSPTKIPTHVHIELHVQGKKTEILGNKMTSKQIAVHKQKLMDFIFGPP